MNNETNDAIELAKNVYLKKAEFGSGMDVYRNGERKGHIPRNATMTYYIRYEDMKRWFENASKWDYDRPAGLREEIKRKLPTLPIPDDTVFIIEPYTTLEEMWEMVKEEGLTGEERAERDAERYIRASDEDYDRTHRYDRWG